MNWKEDADRCGWCVGDPLYERYHDEEWGREVTDDRTMFEFLTLESAQAGLSWITILRRRENYRKAFANFDPEKVAAFTEADVERLLQDPGIIRNRAKIPARGMASAPLLPSGASGGVLRPGYARFRPIRMPFPRDPHEIGQFLPTAFAGSDKARKFF